MLLEMAAVAALVGAAQDTAEWPDHLVLECEGRARTELQRSDEAWRFEGEPLAGGSPIQLNVRVADRVVDGWSSGLEVRPNGLSFPAGPILLEDGSPSSDFSGTYYILGAPDAREFVLLVVAPRADGATMNAGACRRVD